MNRIDKMRRLARIMDAVKQAEMVRLGGALARAEAEEREAERLRTIAALRPDHETGFDMNAQSRWREHLLARARAADHRRDQALAEAAQRRKSVGRAIGREAAVDRLAEEAEAEARQMTQRQADDWPAQRGKLL